MNVCKQCNKVYDEKSQFCEQCGDTLFQNTADVFQCVKCYKLFIDSEFCPNDGQQLKIYQRKLESNQIEIRNVEQYTVQIATQPMLLNMDDFKNCAPPYEGKDSTSFMEYLVNNILYDIESFIDKNESNLNESTKDVLWNLEGHPNEEDVIYDSRNKFSNMWCELGKTNPDFRKNGGFETYETTNND